MLARPLRLVVLAVALSVVGLVACGGMDTPQRPASATLDSIPADNPFLPENRNIGDCVSSLPRPDCGSDARGGSGQVITFVVLMVGMALIGWRIAHSVRKRERARAAAADSDVPTS